jgi:ABC-type antimicrobial peptide transport system permease subunit
MVLLAQTDGPSTSVLEPLRQLARRQDPDVPVFDAQTIERFYELLVTSQLGTVVRMVSGIGVMGMALTMVGLYGMVSYLVSRRTREIGIRMAVGATGAHVTRMVLREGMAPVWFGVGFGLLLSALTTTVVIGLIPTQHQLRPEFYFVVVPLIVAVTAAAAALPARYASRISPTIALRCD